MSKHATEKPPGAQKPTRASRWEVLAFAQSDRGATRQLKSSEPSFRDRAASIALETACETIDAAKAKIEEIRSIAQSSDGMRLALAKAFEQTAGMCDKQDMKTFLLETAQKLRNRTL